MANKVSVDLDMNVQGYVQGIDKATESTEKYESETRKVADAQVNLRKELVAAKKEVQNLAAGYARLDAAAKQSAFGKEMARQLEEAKQKAAEYIDLQGDLNQELKNMASDTHTLDMLSEGMGVLADATSAAMGITAQFTGNEEDAKRAVVAFTTAQSVLGTVTKLQNALQAQSNTMMAVSKVQTLAAAAATRIKVAAEGKNVVVTRAATVAQAAFNAVAKANPYVLLATGILAAVGAIATFISLTKDSESEEDKMQKKIDEANKKIEEQREQLLSTSGAMYNTASRLDHLHAEYLKTNDEVKKTEIIKEASTEFKKLGMEVKSLSDAQRIFKEQGQEVVKLIKLQGDAAAISAMRMAAFQKSMKMLLENGYDVSSARILAGYSKEVQQFDSELDKLNGETAKLKKNLNIKSDVFKNSKSSHKVEIKVEDGSLQKLKDELSKLEEKKIKLNLNKEQLNKLNADIDKKKKEIEEKEIELGIRPKKGSIEDITKQISDLDAQIKRLDPVIDEAKIRKLQIDKAALEDVKKDIEDKFKEVTITGKAFKSDAKAGSLQYASDKTSYYMSKLQVAVDDEDYQHWLKQYKEWKEKETKLQIKIEADTSDVKKGSLEWLSKEKSKYQAVLETSLVGSPEWKDAIANINKLTEKENKIQLAIETAGMSDLEKSISKMQKASSYINDGFGAIDNVVSNFESLTKAIEEDANAWEVFMGVLQTSMSIIESISTVVETFKNLQKLLGDTSLEAANKSSQAATQEAAAATTATAAKSGEAIAGATASGAKLAFPYNIIAIAIGVAAVLAALANIAGAFAGGGIIPGSSYSGDRLTARVNSGEMILNQRQQKNLFNMIDEGRLPQNGGANVTVTGVIHGTDLLLVQKNTSKTMRRAGNSITF